jgi:hypothetical protein
LVIFRLDLFSLGAYRDRGRRDRRAVDKASGRPLERLCWVIDAAIAGGVLMLMLAVVYGRGRHRGRRERLAQVARVPLTL